MAQFGTGPNNRDKHETPSTSGRFDPIYRHDPETEAGRAKLFELLLNSKSDDQALRIAARLQGKITSDNPDYDSCTQKIVELLVSSDGNRSLISAACIVSFGLDQSQITKALIPVALKNPDARVRQLADAAIPQSQAHELLARITKEAFLSHALSTLHLFVDQAVKSGLPPNSWTTPMKLSDGVLREFHELLTEDQRQILININLGLRPGGFDPKGAVFELLNSFRGSDHAIKVCSAIMEPGEARQNSEPSLTEGLDQAKLLWLKVGALRSLKQMKSFSTHARDAFGNHASKIYQAIRDGLEDPLLAVALD